MIDQYEFFIILNNNHNLTVSVIFIITLRFQLQEQIQKQDLKDGGWRFDMNMSMTKHFNKTGELNGSSYVSLPLRSSATMNFQTDE